MPVGSRRKVAIGADVRPPLPKSSAPWRCPWVNMPTEGPLKILMAHNFYRLAARSGEDAVYATESALLNRAGMEVIPFEKHSEAIYRKGLAAKVTTALDVAHSKSVYHELRGILRAKRPDVAHFHAHFPLISPSAFQACRDAGIPTVVTLHNFRLNCAAGTLFRDGHICEECWGGAPWPAIRHRCYQGSYLASMAAARAQWAYRELIDADAWVDQYIALTEFARGRHAEIGIPSERIAVKGNTVLDPPSIGTGAGQYVLFVGRLGPEKGIKSILDAWEFLGAAAPPLKMIGEGPLAQEIASAKTARNLNIELLGARPKSSVMELMSNASMLVFASQCYEGFPLVIVESLACGTPVLASRIGGIPELIKEGSTGALFPPANAEALAQSVLRLSRRLQSDAKMRGNCREEFERRHSAEQNSKALIGIYSAVLKRRA